MRSMHELLDGSDADQGVTLARVTAGPEHIWLVYGDIERDATHADVYAAGDVGWCDAPQFASDVRYVRSDAADAALQRAVLAERERCAAICDGLTHALDHAGNSYRREAFASQCAAAIRKAQMSPVVARGLGAYHIATAGKPIEPSNGWPDTDAERSAGA